MADITLCYQGINGETYSGRLQVEGKLPRWTFQKATFREMMMMVADLLRDCPFHRPLHLKGRIPFHYYFKYHRSGMVQRIRHAGPRRKQNTNFEPRT